MGSEEVTHYWHDVRYMDMTITKSTDAHTVAPDDLTWEGSSTQKVANDNMGTIAIVINPGVGAGNSYVGEGMLTAGLNGVIYSMRLGKSITVPLAIKNQLIAAGYSVT